MQEGVIVGVGEGESKTVGERSRSYRPASRETTLVDRGVNKEVYGCRRV